MTTLGKFPLFIVLTALLAVLGCEKKKAPATDPPKAEEPAENAGGADPGALEARCFEGDPDACDELGH